MNVLIAFGIDSRSYSIEQLKAIHRFFNELREGSESVSSLEYGAIDDSLLSSLIISTGAEIERRGAK